MLHINGFVFTTRVVEFQSWDSNQFQNVAIFSDNMVDLARIATVIDYVCLFIIDNTNIKCFTTNVYHTNFNYTAVMDASGWPQTFSDRLQNFCCISSRKYCARSNGKSCHLFNAINTVNKLINCHNFFIVLALNWKENCKYPNIVVPPKAVRIS